MRSGISGPSHSSLLAGRSLNSSIAADDPQHANELVPPAAKLHRRDVNVNWANARVAGLILSAKPEFDTMETTQAQTILANIGLLDPAGGMA